MSVFAVAFANFIVNIPALLLFGISVGCLHYGHDAFAVAFFVVGALKLSTIKTTSGADKDADSSP